MSELTYGTRCMDCLEGLKSLPDNCIDLTVTSPPYDNLRTYNGFSWDFGGVAKELYRVTKQGGVVVWIVGDQTINGSETLVSFKQALYFKEIGFNVHDTMIYSKGCCVFPDKNRYYQSFEYMFVFVKGKLNTFNPIEDRKNKWGGTSVHGTLRQPNGETIATNGLKSNRKIKDFGIRFNVWDISPERNNKTGHPAVFPEQLAQDHILSWSSEGDVVCDPFSGSGTTHKMALLNKRKFIGFEISQEYVDIEEQRLKDCGVWCYNK